MLKKEYIKKIKDVLIKDLNTKSDLSPKGMFAINEISEEYKGKIQQSVIDIVIDISKWLESYFIIQPKKTLTSKRSVGRR